jgi:hypothetical protein
MTNADRFRLSFGPYRAPRFRYGDVVRCAVRGEVVIVSLSAGKIPWPIGQRRGSTARSFIVYAGLANALRKESNIAVCHWWGVTAQTVSKWRKALGAGPSTEGTRRLKREYAQEEPIVAALKKAQSKAKDPARRAKIAAARRGKPRPRHVIEAMRRGRLGKPQSDETRKKISEANLKRGAWPPAAGRPWTAEEDRMVRELPAADAAQMTGRTLKAVYSRRSDLKVVDGRRAASRPES